MSASSIVSTTRTQALPWVTMTDWPAAHSMDTTWFAVDADGNVGLFETSEQGAVPHRAVSVDEPTFDEFLLRSAHLALALGVDYYLASRDRANRSLSSWPERCVVVTGSTPLPEPADYRTPAVPVASVEKAFGAGEWIVLRPEGPRVVASIAPLDASTVARIEKRSEVASVLTETELDWLDFDEVPGIFRFRHAYTTDDGGPGMYVRSDGAPLLALKVGDLVESQREQVRALSFPLRFAATKSLHLADHLKDEECQTHPEGETLRAEPPRLEPSIRVSPPQRLAVKPRSNNVVRIAGGLFLLAVALFLLLRDRM